MKSPFFALILILSALNLSAQDSDLLAIEAVLNNYMIGGTERDGERITSAFHETAMMKYIRGGEYSEVNAKEFFGSPKPGEPLERSNEIVSIDISGNVGMAKLRLRYADKQFIDYMTLMKIDGEWTIVNKVFNLERF